MKAFATVLLILSTLVVATSACQIGEDLLKPGNATVYELEYGTYTGFRQDLDPSVDTQICFYVPDITVDCLSADALLSACQQPNSCTQYEEDDVINDNENKRIVNFRMMPPDDELDEVVVIRLYNRTVVWLAKGQCSWPPNVRYEWKPRLYTYFRNDTPYCLPTANTTTVTTTTVTTTAVPPSTTTVLQSTPPSASESVTAKEWAGISSGVAGIILLAVGITAAFICGVVYGKSRQRSGRIHVIGNSAAGNDGRNQAAGNDGRNQAAGNDGRNQAAGNDGRNQAVGNDGNQAAGNDGRNQAAGNDGNQAAGNDGRNQAAENDGDQATNAE